MKFAFANTLKLNRLLLKGCWNALISESTSINFLKPIIRINLSLKARIS